MKTVQDVKPAKEKLLDAAQGLMLSKGYTATRLEEICEEAGLTKGSFFHYFESKEDLCRVVLERYVSGMFNMIQAAPFLKKKDPLQRVFGYLDFLADLSKHPDDQKGCLLGTLAQELSDTHPKFRNVCERHFKKWADQIRRELNQAKTYHRPKSSVDSEGLSEYLIALVEGTLILSKALGNPKVMERNLFHFKRYLIQLFST